MTEPRIFFSVAPDKAKNYANAFRSCGFSVTEDYSSADALCLCGGGDVSPCSYGQKNICSKNVDLARDQKEFYLLKKFLDRNKPVFAVCRGLQVVNVFFGGTLFQNVCGHDQINGKDARHSVSFYGSLKRLFGKCGVVNSAHHQAIRDLGKGLTVTAVSGDGVIEAVECKNVSAFQFHPERLDTDGLNGKKFFEQFYNEYFG